jgi:hypothetical protein
LTLLPGPALAPERAHYAGLRRDKLPRRKVFWFFFSTKEQKNLLFLRKKKQKYFYSWWLWQGMGLCRSGI